MKPGAWLYLGFMYVVHSLSSLWLFIFWFEAILVLPIEFQDRLQSCLGGKN